jgi:hypothetical protein
VDDAGASCTTVDERRLEVVVHRLGIFTNPEVR